MEHNEAKALIEQRLNDFLSEDISKHRSFLEAMFTRVIWSFGILALATAGIGTWIFVPTFETAIDTAAKTAVGTAVKNTIGQEDFVKKVGIRIDKELKTIDAQISTRAIQALDKAIEGEQGQRFDTVVSEKIEEIRRLDPENIFDSTQRQNLQFDISLHDISAAPVTRRTLPIGRKRFCFLTGVADENRINNSSICRVNFEAKTGEWELYAYGAGCWAACVE